MNKFLQKLFVIIFPFYPFWGWLSYILVKQNVGMLVSLLCAPIALFYIISSKKKIPLYLVFFLCFTTYHLFSVYYNDLAFIYSTNWLSFVLSDIHVRACFIFIIAENIVFDEKYFKKLSQLIFLSLIISLVVSLIQIKYVDFFVSPEITSNDENLIYLRQNRNFSIYSWANLNSLGITFPIFASLLLGIQDSKKGRQMIVILSSIVVIFLARARYAMISVIIVLSQLLISTRLILKKKIYFLVGMTIGIIFLLWIANSIGFNVDRVINERILEKEGDMGSAKTRIKSYNVFVLKFPEHPWFGVGPYTRPDVRYLLGDSIPLIHVGYLSYLYYYGMIGSIILFLSLFYLLKEAWVVGRKNKYWGSFYGLVTFCFANLTFVYFNLSEAGIIMALIFLRYYTNLDVAQPENDVLLKN